jgi:hypothetical protein
VEEGVGDNGACIGEPEQRVIGEHCAKAQQASNEQSLNKTENNIFKIFGNLGSRFLRFFGLIKTK